MLSTHLLLLILISCCSATTFNFDVKLAQTLLNLGFHRNISYNVMFDDKYGDRNIYEDCFIGIDQMLPAGVYAYPDELEDLMRMNKFTAISKNRVNVELPAEQSQPTGVFIIGQLRNGEVNLWLPVHARYHKAVKGGSLYHNRIEPPHVYLRCPHINLEQCKPQTSLIAFLCSASGKEICTWKEISVTLTTQPISLSVPVGNLDDNNIVAPFTLGAVIISSLYLAKTLHEYKLAMTKNAGKLKK